MSFRISLNGNSKDEQDARAKHLREISLHQRILILELERRFAFFAQLSIVGGFELVNFRVCIFLHQILDFVILDIHILLFALNLGLHSKQTRSCRRELPVPVRRLTLRSRSRLTLASDSLRVTSRSRS